MEKKLISNFSNISNKILITDPLYGLYGDDVSDQGYINNVYVGNWEVYVRETKTHINELFIVTENSDHEWVLYEDCAIQDKTGMVGIFDIDYYRDDHLAEKVSEDIYMAENIEAIIEIKRLYESTKYGPWYALCFGSVLKNKGYCSIPYGCVVAVDNLNERRENEQKSGPYEVYITKSSKNIINGIKIIFYDYDSDSDKKNSESERESESEESESESESESDEESYETTDEEVDYETIIRNELGDEFYKMLG